MNEQNFNPSTSPSGTSFVPAICTNCGGELTVNPSQEACVCKYCGTPFVVSKAVQNYEIQHTTYTTNVVNDQRKGTVESVLDYVSDRQDKKQQRIDEKNRRREEKKKSRNRMILWVLGWLFIFPIPLSILMLRNKNLSNKFRLGIIGAGWAMYLIFLLVNRNGSTTEIKKDSSETLAETSVSDVIDVTPESEIKTAPEIAEEIKTGFDDSTNIEVKNGGLIYHIPNYYTETDTTTDNYVLYKHEEEDGSFAQVGFSFLVDEQLNDGISKDEAKTIFQNWLKNLNLGDDVEVSSITQDPVLDRTEYEIIIKKKSGNEYIWGYMAIIENKEIGGVNMYTSYIYRKNADIDTEYDYLADMDSIFYSIAADEDFVYEAPAESDSKDDTSADDIKKAVENGDYSLVTPEFKETMDAYEAFYDEYIEFMNKYNSGEGDIMSMLNDYTEMMNKLNEWSEKIDAIDESTLSPADDAYFLLVTLRIEKKLIGAIY